MKPRPPSTPKPSGLIQDAIARLLEGRTSLIIAHRLSTIQRCDRILVFHHGKLREEGTPEELLALRGIYYRLYQLQYGRAIARAANPSCPLTLGEFSHRLRRSSRDQDSLG